MLQLAVEAEPGAEVCPDQRVLAARVEAILQRPVGAEIAASLAIDVRFERATDGAFVARVTSHGVKPGQRMLRDTDPTCSALGEAVSVAIALLLDSALKEDGQADASAEPQAATATATSTAPSTPTPAPTPAVTVAPSAGSESRRWKPRVSLEAGGSYGLGGNGSLLGFGRLGVQHGSWLFDVGAGGPLPTEQNYGGGSVETSLIFASLRACYLIGRSPAVGPCLQLGAGRLHGEGGGYGQDQSSSLPWTAGGAGLAGEAALGSGFFVTAGVSLWVSTRRQSFSVENRGIAWESRPVAGEAAAGLGVTLF
jgi:hypothetical protein